MLDSEKIIKHLLKKYGYNRQPSPNPTYANKRMKKMMDEFLLFYDEDKEKLKKDLNSTRRNVKWMFKFIQNNGLEAKYKKECLKDLII